MMHYKIRSTVTDVSQGENNKSHRLLRAHTCGILVLWVNLRDLLGLVKALDGVSSVHLTSLASIIKTTQLIVLF